ncbi:helix-turn-helix domain-containing protein [Silvibacterium acidisoli]|uniref:helix-turn-helix domain-containing protein n=1 Tax=Acidobacteriaceae bacterium ZG23-2 TaxID=2883246 RepID=UPI00406C091A
MRDDGVEHRMGLEEFERFLDSQQVADLIGVHPETVKRRARRGEIPGLKFGKLWRFRASVLESCIREMMPETADANGQDMAPLQPAVRAARNGRK